MLSRMIAGLVMGSVALGLVGLLALVVPRDAGVAFTVTSLLSIGALVGTVLIVVQSASATAAWRRLCLADGALSIVLGAASLGLRRAAEWPSEWGYEHDIEHAIGPLPPAHVLWVYATYLGIAAVVLGAILFAVSYWLSPPHSGRGRRAH